MASGDTGDGYRSRFHRFPLPTFVWRRKDEDFVLHDFNQAALAVTNGGIAGLVGTKATSFFRDREDIVDDIFTCFEGKVDFTTETDYTFVTTGDSRRLKAFCVYVPPDSVMVHIDDVSEVHSATKTMLESEQRYKALFNSSTDAVIVHDFSGRFLDVNPTACKQLGYTREEILELRATDVYSDEILALFRGYQNQLIEEGYITFETEYKNRSGTMMPVDVRTGIIDYGDRKAVLTIARDMTEHKLYEAELKKSKESMQLALLGADIAVWDWDISSGTVNRSPKWAEMLGYTPEDIASSIHVWEDLIHPDDMQGALERLKAHLEGEAEAYVSEHRLKTKDGKWMWVLEKGRIAERDRKGKPLRLSGTHIDVTGPSSTRPVTRYSWCPTASSSTATVPPSS
jgi:PAS domain S-box-containing protein